MTEQEQQNIELELTEVQREALKVTGTWVLEVVLDKSDYSLTDVSKICDISPAWLRILLKEGRIEAFKDGKGHWRMKREVLARTWKEQVEKYANRAVTIKDGKKYTYRRPSEWATHLVERFLQKTTVVSASRKKIVREVMKQAKAQWDVDYAERLRKKAEKAAEEAKKAKK